MIYFAKTMQGLIYMLTIYPKSETENIPAHVLRKILEEVENAKAKA